MKKSPLHYPDLSSQLTAQEHFFWPSQTPLSQGLVENILERLANAENTIEMLNTELGLVNRKLSRMMTDRVGE